MAYNKAKAEREWLQWKEAEEKTMREKGVDEDAIQRLHTYDWEAFKSERNYLRWQIPNDEFIRKQAAEEIQLPISEINQLLDSIDNPALLTILKQADKQTLEAVFLKIAGYSAIEIAEKIGISQKAVNLRFVRLRKKIKNIFFA